MHNKLVLRLDPQNVFYILLSLIWSKFMVVDQLSSILNRILGETVSNSIVVIFFAFLLFFSLNYIIKNVSRWNVLFAIVFIAVYFLSAWIHTGSYSSKYLLDNTYRILILNFGMFFIGLRIDEEEIIDWLHIVSVIVVFLFVYFLFFHITSFRFGQIDEFMGYAYLLLPHLCLITGCLIKDKKAIDIISLIVGTIMLFACGSRGPIILFLCYVVFNLISMTDLKRKPIYIIIIGLLCILAWLNSTFILQVIRNIMNSLGTSTRIIDMILSNSLLEDRGRSTITNQMIELIKSNPIFGYGLAGDRGYSWTAYSSTFDIAYAHNIVLEFWVSFGVIAGSLLMIVLAKTVFSAYRYRRKSKLNIIILSLAFSNGLLYLLMSGSFLLSPNFFLLLGVCVSSNREKRISKLFKRVNVNRDKV